MSKFREFRHLNGSGAPFKGVGGPKDLIHRLSISAFVFQHKDIPLKTVYLSLSFAEKVLKKFFVVGVQIIAHNVDNVYTQNAFRQEKGP